MILIKKYSRSWIWFPIKGVFFIVVLPQLTFRKEGRFNLKDTLGWRLEVSFFSDIIWLCFIVKMKIA